MLTEGHSIRPRAFKRGSSTIDPPLIVINESVNVEFVSDLWFRNRVRRRLVMNGKDYENPAIIATMLAGRFVPPIIGTVSGLLAYRLHSRAVRKSVMLFNVLDGE